MAMVTVQRAVQKLVQHALPRVIEPVAELGVHEWLRDADVSLDLRRGLLRDRTAVASDERHAVSEIGEVVVSARVDLRAAWLEACQEIASKRCAFFRSPWFQCPGAPTAAIIALGMCLRAQATTSTICSA